MTALITTKKTHHCDSSLSIVTWDISIPWFAKNLGGTHSCGWMFTYTAYTVHDSCEVQLLLHFLDILEITPCWTAPASVFQVCSLLMQTILCAPSQKCYSSPRWQTLLEKIIFLWPVKVKWLRFEASCFMGPFATWACPRTTLPQVVKWRHQCYSSWTNKLPLVIMKNSNRDHR